MLLKLSNALKIYNTQTILDHIQFEIKEKEVVGIIGRNGCGKSTLLKVISKEIALDSGEIHYGRNVSVGYLRQDVFCIFR